MYDIHYHPRPHPHHHRHHHHHHHRSKNGGAAADDHHAGFNIYEPSAAAAAGAGTGAAGAPRKIRVASAGIADSCRSLSSTPSAYSFSPYSLASPVVTKKPTPAAAEAQPQTQASSKATNVVLEDEEAETMQALLEKFSTLEAEIKCLLKEKNSLKDRIQSLGNKQECTKSVIQNLNQLKKERMQSLAQANSEECTDLPLDQELLRSSLSSERSSTGVLKRIVTCWDENNCDLHLKRLIHSSRQIAAYEILEFAHKRLSTHLINHISETARSLVGDEKTAFLAQFIKHGPFESKPVGEGTYGELLRFVQREEKPKKDMVKALKSAEDSLVAEAVKAGYRAVEIGDIRSQMTGFFTTAVQNYSRYCHPIPLADTELTSEIVEDTQKAAEQGKLGVMQKASKLIKLGCYFLRWQLAAEEHMNS